MALQSGTMTLTQQQTAVPVTAGPCREVTLHNDDAAALVIKVGNNTAQNYTLGPGQAIKIPVTNRNLVWVKCSTAASPVMSWLSS